MRASRVAVIVLFVGLASAAHAVTYIVPSDRELIQNADDIVIVTGLASAVELNRKGGIVTRYTVRIDEVLKGHRFAGDELVITELGGRIDGRIQYIPGTPAYRKGERYLVFTTTDPDGEPTTLGMGLGQFLLVSHDKRRLALRADIRGYDQNLEAHVERSRDAEGLLEYIRDILEQRVSPEARYFRNDVHVEWRPEGGITTHAAATRTSYLMQDVGGQGFRWNNPVASIRRNGAVTGADGAAAATVSRDQWNGTDSSIAYSDGGVDATALGGLLGPDGKNTILYNDPNGEVPPGVAGRGGITSAGSPYMVGAETFWDIFEVDVVINNQSFAQNCLNSVVVHEVGHTLAFRHSNQPPTTAAVCTTDAIMNSTTSCAHSGVLRLYDQEAASVVYGDGPNVPAPANVVAAATSTSSITISWTPALGALTYNVYRSTDGVCFTLIGNTALTSLSDGGRSANTSYLYKVRSVNVEESSDSDEDIGTTVLFTDDPLVGGTTRIKTPHITELRTAVNAVRALAGLSAATFTDPTLTGGTTRIKAVHVTELRTAIDAARSALNLPAIGYGEAVASGVRIKSAHITELRNGVK